MHGSNIRNSLYSYPYLKLEKTICFSSYFLCFLFNKIGGQEGRTGSAWKQGRRGIVAQTMYTNVSKCKKQ
jgi:hypothetical protein